MIKVLIIMLTSHCCTLNIIILHTRLNVCTKVLTIWTMWFYSPVFLKLHTQFWNCVFTWVIHILEPYM